MLRVNQRHRCIHLVREDFNHAKMISLIRILACCNLLLFFFCLLLLVFASSRPDIVCIKYLRHQFMQEKHTISMLSLLIKAETKIFFFFLS